MLVIEFHASSGDELHRDDGEISKDLANGSGLFALQALVRPVALRFRYHFEGERQTNRLDKVCLAIWNYSRSIINIGTIAGVVYCPYPQCLT